ncbi:MAG: cell division protein FtsZ, partial [Thermoplasmata archaeon]
NFYMNNKNNICVLGIGGAGTNTINRIYNFSEYRFYTIAINTDMSHLNSIKANKKIFLNVQNGTGGIPEIGALAAFRARDDIVNSIKGFGTIFIISGFGGGTGTGATIEVTKMAIETGALVINIVTIPFKAEGSRYRRAIENIRELAKISKTLIILDNNRLLKITPRFLPIEKAFAIMDQLIFWIVTSFYEMLFNSSQLHISFSEVRNLLNEGGYSTILYNEGTIDSIDETIKGLIDNSLIEVNLSKATSAIVFIMSGEDLSLEIFMRRIIGGISNLLGKSESITPGILIDNSLGNKIRILVIITNVIIPIIEQKGFQRELLRV